MSPRTPILDTLTRRIGRDIDRQPDLAAVITSIQSGDRDVWVDHVLRLQGGDRAAADVILWSLAPAVVSRAYQFQRNRPLPDRVDEILTSLYMALTDVDPTDIPSAQVVVHRAYRRAHRAACHSWDMPIEDEELARRATRQQCPFDPTADHAIARDDLAKLGRTLATGIVSKQTWGTLVAIRVHGDISDAHGHGSTVRTQIERATRTLRNHQIAS